MSDVSLLLWLIPGYILLEFLKRIVPKRNQSGWDFIARVGFSALFLFVLSTILFPIVKSVTPDCIISWFGRSFPVSQVTKTLPIGLALAFMLGVIAVMCPGFRKVYWDISQLDPYLQLVKQAKDKTGGYLLVTMKNGKVYVGQLVNATFDPNETTRSLVLAVELSGYREPSNGHAVRFNKNYVKNIDKKKDRSILLPYGEIVSVSPFDFEIHQAFVNDGITLLGQEPASGS